MTDIVSAEAENAVQPWVLDPDRVDPSITSLRRHAARGSVINSIFNVGLFGLGTFQRFVVAIWLTKSDYGLWGILLAAITAITWIKQFGVGDKFVQQSEPDQELAFQKAFTLELCLSAGFFVVACAALPLYALAYGRPHIIVPGIVLALAVPLTTLESPMWIPYRRMQYARQRFLSLVDPVTALVVSISLTAAGFGYWGLIIAAIAGSVLGAIVCLATCPYRIRLRLDWATVKSYASFSLPLVGFGLCGFITLQGTVLVANYSVGLAGIGAIGLASNILGWADGVDGIVSQTLYPAICAVAHRTQVLAEAFIKSNRVALMWGMPAMVGVALFAADLVHFVFGDRWRSAIPLFIALALTAGLAQVGFNWAIFMRAVNRTKPIFLASVVDVVVFLAVCVPSTLALGLTGYAIGVAAMTVTQVALRGYWMRQLFGDFSALRQLVRAVLPTIPGVVVVLLVRLPGGDRSLLRAVGELMLYGGVVAAATYLFERPLVHELAGYLRKVKGRRSEVVVANSGAQVSPV